MITVCLGNDNDFHCVGTILYAYINCTYPQSQLAQYIVSLVCECLTTSGQFFKFYFSRIVCIHALCVSNV